MNSRHEQNPLSEIWGRYSGEGHSQRTPSLGPVRDDTNSSRDLPGLWVWPRLQGVHLRGPGAHTHTQAGDALAVAGKAGLKHPRHRIRWSSLIYDSYPTCFQKDGAELSMKHTDMKGPHNLYNQSEQARARKGQRQRGEGVLWNNSTRKLWLGSEPPVLQEKKERKHNIQFPLAINRKQTIKWGLSNLPRILTLWGPREPGKGRRRGMHPIPNTLPLQGHESI